MARDFVDILLVEDEEAHAEAVKRAFQATEQPIHLKLASNLQEALAQLRESIPDLVITDWLLPDGKGTDILRSDKAHHLFPLVLMTSHGNEQIAVDAMKAGAVDYVVKSRTAFAEMPRVAERVLRQWELLAENKRAQEALRASEQRFRSIFQESRDCMFLKDRSLRYTDVNPACERLVGLPASKIIGLRYDALFGKEGADHINEVESRVLCGKTIEEEYTRKINGIPMTFLDTRIPLKDESGNIVSILVISRDITDRKRVEAVPLSVEEYPSKTMQAALRQAASAAKRKITVLLLGESGSGKDYLARYIHDHSSRASGPYFAINCAAIVPELAESELFGHEKGAFTGAVARKRGLLELAEGGTILLNEIGELSLALQAKLLTFLDTRNFTRVGGEKEISVDARLIAATNRDLQEEVEQGRFRQDLFYRINMMSIRVPSLRERTADIPVLAREILAQLRAELQIHENPVIDPGAMNALKSYDWPGNVRELRNVLERALIVSGGKSVDLGSVQLKCHDDPSIAEESFTHDFALDKTLPEVTDEVARVMCMQALKRCGGNKKTAARTLGISRDTLYRYLEKFGIAGVD